MKTTRILKKTLKNSNSKTQEYIKYKNQFNVTLDIGFDLMQVRKKGVIVC